MPNEFETELTILVSQSLAKAHNDAKQRAAMTAKLAHALAFVITMSARGDKKKIDELLMGTEAYMAQIAVDLIPIAKAMSG